MGLTAIEHRDKLVKELTSTREDVLSIIRQLPEEQLEEACIGTWCAKDLLAHLIGWDYTNLQAVQDISAYKRPAFFLQYDKDWQTYNAQLVARYRRNSIEALLADAQQSQHAFTAYLYSLPIETVLRGKSDPAQGRTVTVRGLLRAEISDERTHAKQLRQHFYTHPDAKR